MNAEHKLIINELKKILKERKVTYKALSIGTDISESTLKKVFSGGDCSFSKVIEICQFLDLRFIDIASEIATRKEDEVFWLTLEQEQFFSRNLLYYLFFNKIYRDSHSVKEAKEFFRIDDIELWKILRKLEEFKLLELYEDYKIKFQVVGGLRFLKEGPLQNIILDKLSHSLVDHLVKAPLEKEPVDSPFLRMNFAKLTPEQFSRFTDDMRELDMKYRQLATRSRKFESEERLIHASWLIGLTHVNGFDLISDYK